MVVPVFGDASTFGWPAVGLGAVFYDSDGLYWIDETTGAPVHTFSVDYWGDVVTDATQAYVTNTMYVDGPPMFVGAYDTSGTQTWQKNVFGRTSFDSTLCFLARADREVVAAEMCSQRFGMGFVDSVGVRKPWRRRGLGRALLLQGFGELYQRGERRIGLGVDASNPTGATRLYERVGMRVAWQADTYEKAL